PACLASATSVLKCPAATAVWTMFRFAGFAGADDPPAAPAAASAAATRPAAMIRALRMAGHRVSRATAAGPHERGEPQRLVDRRQPDEAVHDPRGRVRLAEVEAEDPGDEVELGQGHEAPVKPAHPT